MSTNEIAGNGGNSSSSWRKAVATYEQPALRRSLWQLGSTLSAYIALWCIAYLAIHISYWLTAGVSLVAAGFLVRVFIIFHDCGHGSFFKRYRTNRVVGFITGVLTFTPYEHWRWEHGLHHGTAGDLDRRGAGDVWTLTVQEYLQATRWKRLAYRLARNPFILFVLAPLFLFLVKQRFPSPKAGPNERRSVYLTNLTVLALAAGLCSLMGWKAYLFIQLAILLPATVAGVWLFYVQHQFEGVYWERGEKWDYLSVALQGSSFYKLPKILQWFSGNIGFHHIHHLSPRIPNYNLERCHRAEPLFQTVKPVTFWSSFKSLSFRLWDEKRRQLVGYWALRPARNRRGV